MVLKRKTRRQFAQQINPSSICLHAAPKLLGSRARVLFPLNDERTNLCGETFAAIDGRSVRVLCSTKSIHKPYNVQ